MSGLTSARLTELWRVLAHSARYMQDVRCTHNFIDRSALDSLIESLTTFVGQCSRLVHLDLTGCHLGDRLLEVADAMANAHSLQAVHLSDNSLSEATVDEFKLRFKIQKNYRKKGKVDKGNK